MTLVIDSILRKRAEQALRDAQISVRRVIQLHAPVDTGDPLECWYIDGDGTGDWVYMEEIAQGKLKVVRDP